MSRRFVPIIGAVAAVIAVATLAPRSMAGQSPSKTSTPLLTPDNHSNLEGIWTNATVTPLERPRELAGKEFLTEAEATEHEKQARERNNGDRRDRDNIDNDLAVGYNDIWWDRGTKVVASRRTSLIVDPADGRIPPLTPEAQRKADARAEARRLHPSDGPEDRSLDDRCIKRGTSGPPMLQAGYNNNYQIVQTPQHLAIVTEMIHETRIIPMDGSPHGSVRQLLGDSRGRWEGKTLVVETTNLTDKTNFRGSGENLHVIERFTRVDEDTLLYRFTVDDPQSFTKPWSAEISWKRIEGPVYEYACHEGNYSMANTLRNARAEEKAGRSARQEP